MQVIYYLEGVSTKEDEPSGMALVLMVVGVVLVLIVCLVILTVIGIMHINQYTPI